MRLGRVGSRGWWAMYHPRFVLDGIRSLFRLVFFYCVFMFKSNSLVSPKDLQCFSGVDRTRRGLVGLKYTPEYIF